MKFSPVFPEGSGNLEVVQEFMDVFVDGYNHIHWHRGIGLNTAADVHYGLAGERNTTREIALAQARARHPGRSSPAVPSYQKFFTPPTRLGSSNLSKNEMTISY